MDSRPHCLVIGAGFTGCAIAYDLARRGFRVSVFERGDIANGTSGRTHGLLHSGARYCATDSEAAIECIEENRILKRIARGCIEDNGGLFIALHEDDLAYAAEFELGAQRCGIPIDLLSPSEVLSLEPAVNPGVLAAYHAPDAAFDPLRLALAFAASARMLGSEFFTFSEVTSITFDGSGKVTGLGVWDRSTGTRKAITGDMVINATGAWAGEMAAQAGLTIAVIPTPGVMVAYESRPVQHVINRLFAPGDGDILVPQRRMVLIGTTSYSVHEVDYIPIVEDQVSAMKSSAEQLVPTLTSSPQRGVWVSARPLVGDDPQGRGQSRSFRMVDHSLQGAVGLYTITGGKATTCRLMAEKLVDSICSRIGWNIPCTTAEVPLSDYRAFYR